MTLSLPNNYTAQQSIVAWSNFTVLLVSSTLLTVYYIKSAKPASLEREIGIAAYERCKWYRIISSAFMTVAGANYVVYYFYPLPILHEYKYLSLPRTFPWPYWISVVIAMTIGLPFGYLMWVGMRDAGEETMSPKKQHTLYSGGIYEHMRHPQAVGEFPLWWTIAFLVHSPFLALFSFLYLPIWWYFCIEEERDLLLRYGSAYEQYRQCVGWFPKVNIIFRQQNRNKLD